MRNTDVLVFVEVPLTTYYCYYNFPRRAATVLSDIHKSDRRDCLPDSHVPIPSGAGGTGNRISQPTEAVGGDQAHDVRHLPILCGDRRHIVERCTDVYGGYVKSIGHNQLILYLMGLSGFENIFYHYLDFRIICMS